MLAMILPVSVLGFRSKGAKDAFDKELVCVHIFQQGFKIPEPLWEQHASIPVRRAHSDLFNLQIPELIICETEKNFLSIFEYFWPIERSEFNDTLRKVSVEYEKLKISGKSDVSEFSRYLENINAETERNIKNTAIVFTLNDFTRYFVADYLNLWRTFGIDEFVLFKDPSEYPYLCSYQSLQKGFKRPPPI